MFSQTTFTARVVGVTDGDTVVVFRQFKQPNNFTFSEIDCPENSQPFGNKAKQFTSQEIYRKQIKYSITDIDRYGRSIAMIYYDEVINT
ncbi:thermonuclease family protein [Flavobacterium lacustre]|uniref:thermonuclease family protein n=1 Tax=Flavobacterium lacustre TaxID=3016339 RepID=UPI0022B67A96|nr:thermonuclease family protein [Flavobacterium lacustre]